MSVIAKKSVKYGVYVAAVLLAAMIAFFGFNSQQGSGGKLSSGDISDFFTAEILADSSSSGGDCCSSDDGDGDDGG